MSIDDTLAADDERESTWDIRAAEGGCIVGNDEEDIEDDGREKERRGEGNRRA